MKRELDPTDFIFSAMLRLHRDQCSAYRRFITLSVLAVLGLAACLIHKRVEQVVNFPVDATAALTVAALALGVLEVRTLRRAQASLQELCRRHRIARLKGR